MNRNSLLKAATIETVYPRSTFNHWYIRIHVHITLGIPRVSLGLLWQKMSIQNKSSSKNR